ncbi:MAG: hypothetical protein M1823_000152 [Watsoniomyces obsoletus]|nr:MAG: hypothetical protein M1823_000152 [Watsoniomyces obsoletus]
MDHYNHLVKEGCLDAKYQLAEVPTNHKERITDRPPTKEIPVYCWQQSIIRGPFVYSVIRYPPIVNHGALSKLLEFDEAGKKALNAVGAAAELGIASFMDVKWFEKEIEKKRKKGGKGQKGRPKKTQIHTGQRGKPRKNVDPTDVFLIGEREQMLAEQTAAAAAAAGDEEEEEDDEAEEAMGGMDDLDLLEHMDGLSAEEMEEQLEMMDI